MSTATQPVAGSALNLDAAIRAEAARVLEYPDIWLTTPHEQLGYKRPDDLVREQGEAGKKIVMGLLNAIREGVFT